MTSETNTFHQYPEDVSEDGDGGAEDEDGEQERTDGICNLILGLKEREGEKRFEGLKLRVIVV